MKTKFIQLLFIALIVYSCDCPICTECPKDDCTEISTRYDDLKVRYDTLENKYANLLEYCQTQGVIIDTCEYPDTFRIITDTVPVNVYQNCFFCVKDSFKINSIYTGYIGYDQDTFIIATDTVARLLQFKRYKIIYKDTVIYRYANDYFRPLVENEDYTDIKIYGFSSGVHHGIHDYEFAGTKLTVNGTDSLVKYGDLIYYDLPQDANGAYYEARVMMPLSLIKTVELEYFNDQTNVHTAENGSVTNEDINLYLTGISVGGVNLFNPGAIPKGANYGWVNENTMYILVIKGRVIVNVPYLELH